MVNKELAAIFGQIADLLEIKGEDRFRVNSYRRCARTIGDLTDDVADLARAGQLTQIPGIGKGTAEKIQQYLATGKVALHLELLAEIPDYLEIDPEHAAARRLLDTILAQGQSIGDPSME